MKILILGNNETDLKKLSELFANFAGSSECEFETNLDRGLDIGIANQYDLIILGHTQSSSVCKNFISKLRQQTSTPLIVLTDEDVDARVGLLNSGADSCLSLDCNEDELFAVANAIMRRVYKNFGGNIYEFKNLQVNFFEKTVKIDGQDIAIVAKMYDLFVYLIKNKDLILSKTTLFNRVWGIESETTFSVVEVYISKLRKILEQGGLAGQLLTIKNAGYSWTEKEVLTN